ncbi:Maf1 regulator, partial [Ascobolus immersus RN42]
FLRIPGLDAVNSILTHETYDRKIIGGCDIFATKSVSTDRKAFKQLSSSLDSRYASDLATTQTMASLHHQHSGSSSSPLTSPDSDDRKLSLSPELLLSSPFGPLNEPNSKKTFAYLLGTLNAVHPDYNFFSVLRPWDFKRERSLRKVIADFDGYFLASTPSSSTSPGPTRGSSAVRASTGIWSLLDREMDLRHCQIWSYRPEDDDLLLEDEGSDSEDGDEAEGTLWSVHYFFYSKAKKRVAYLHLK